MSRKYMYTLIDIFIYHPACCAHVLSHTATRQHHTLNHRLREFVCFIEVFNSLFEVRPGHGWRGQCLPNYRFSYHCDINENVFQLSPPSVIVGSWQASNMCFLYDFTSLLAFCELEHLKFDLGQTNRLSRLVTSWNVFALYAGRFVIYLLASMAIAKCEILATNKENNLRWEEKSRLLMQHDVSRRCESENNC